MFHFSDLKKEKQIDFISKNLSEILFKQRHELNLSQEQFLKKFFPSFLSLAIFTT